VESAAILAGGRATRFGGRDKGALVVGGRTILQRQLTELARVTDDILIVGAGGGRPGAENARAAAADGIALRTIVDRVPGCGPLGGIHAALTEARGDAVFVVACDMPYLSAAFVSYLLGLARDADAVVPRCERGYHPVCAVYTRACLEPVARRLAGGQLKTIDLMLDVRTRIVTPEELDRFGGGATLLANVNTPDEYAGLAPRRDHNR
jgi:molybdopterin-guanine dinucleotide biosynthesis protein A